MLWVNLKAPFILIYIYIYIFFFCAFTYKKKMEIEKQGGFKYIIRLKVSSGTSVFFF